MTTQTEALTLALEALEQLQGGCTDSDDGTVEAITVWCPEVIDAIKEALNREAMDSSPNGEAQPEQEPVAWRDHVEQRLLTWRQSFVNRSGDQLALDDFMDKRSLDDLIEFVCDAYTTPPPQVLAPRTDATQRKPLTDEQINTIWHNSNPTNFEARSFARVIESAHGIKGEE